MNQVESSFVLDLRAGIWCRDRGRSEEEVPSCSGKTSALWRQLDYTSMVGLATMDPVLKNLEPRADLRLLRFNELTTESAVESLNVTNCKFTSNKVTYFVQSWSVEQRTLECDLSLHRSEPEIVEDLIE